MTASRLNQVSRKAGALRPGLAFLAVSAIALALTGCKHTDDPTRVEGWTLVDASERHPILVSQQPTTHIVKVPPGANGLSGGQRAQLLDFADHYRATDNGASRLVIQAPSGGANEVSSMYAVSQIRALLTDQGFAENMISVEAYDANGTREPPIRVSYLRFVAEPPPCGNWSTNLANEPMNFPIPISAAPISTTSPPWSPILPISWGRAARPRATACAATRCSPSTSTASPRARGNPPTNA